MSDAAPETSGDEAPDPSVQRAERRLRLLEELSEIGMELVRGLRARTTVDGASGESASGEAPSEAGPGRLANAAEAFARLSRAVRLTLALEAKTDQALQDLKSGLAPAREEARARAADYERLAAERARVAAAQDRDAREARVFDLVFTAAEVEIGDSEAFDDLLEALTERLDQDEAYGDLLKWPLRETVERLCRDLDLTPDWSRWEDEGWTKGYAPLRPRFSRFNRPSRRPLLSPVEPPPPDQPQVHALE
jgi:hypothetical protein